MEREKKERLQSRGWKVGTVVDFLDLAPEEDLLIDIKARLAVAVGEAGKISAYCSLFHSGWDPRGPNMDQGTDVRRAHRRQA